MYTSKSRKAVVVNIEHECEIYEGGPVLELGYVIFQTSGNIFPKQYASHDDKEVQIEHWYTQPAFHKKTQ